MFRRGMPQQGFFPEFFDIFMNQHQQPFGMDFVNEFVGTIPTPPSEDAHPPASRRFMNTIPEVVVTKEDLDAENTNGECAICLTDQSIGQMAARMPCGHLFCGSCLKRWLEKSNTCPVCRYEVETDNPEYEARRMQNMKGRKMRFRHRELETKAVPELRGLMRMLGVSCEGCIEKADMIRRLEESGKIELMKTCTAQQVYSLSELMSMDLGALRRLMTGLGVRVANSETKPRLDLIRALANSGRIIVSTEGASAEEIADLHRQLSSNGVRRDVDMEAEPELRRTQAATPLSRAMLEGMRISQLKELLAQRRISLDGLVEKKDLIDRLLE